MVMRKNTAGIHVSIPVFIVNRIGVQISRQEVHIYKMNIQNIYQELAFFIILITNSIVKNTVCNNVFVNSLNTVIRGFHNNSNNIISNSQAALPQPKAASEKITQSS